MKGYYVDWRQQKRYEKENNFTKRKIQPTTLEKHADENHVVSADSKFTEASADHNMKIILPAPTSTDNECGDNIILKNGNEIAAKITEISSDLIKYKRCDNFDGPIYSIKKDEVFMVKYQNGTKEVFNTPTNSNSNTSSNYNPKQHANTANNTMPKKFNGLAIAAFIVSILGLFVFAVLFEPLALLFSFISLSKIKKSNYSLKGKGLAIAAMIIALIGLALFLVALSLM